MSIFVLAFGRIPSNGQNAVLSHLQAQRAAVKMLHDRIQVLLSYVSSVIAGMSSVHSPCEDLPLHFTIKRMRRKITQLFGHFPPSLLLYQRLSNLTSEKNSTRYTCSSFQRVATVVIIDPTFAYIGVCRCPVDCISCSTHEID